LKRHRGQAPEAHGSRAGKRGRLKSSSLAFSWGADQAADLGKGDAELVRPDSELPGLNLAGAGAFEPAGDLCVDAFEFLQQLGSDLAARLPLVLGLARQAQAAVKVGFKKGKQSRGAGVIGGSLPVVFVVRGG
jgi:hypothetical protein